MLTLPIKKKWFDMIVLGEKKEEYRAEKPYWKKRFQNAGMLDDNGISTLKPVDIAFRNGYSEYSPTIYAQVVLKHGYGRTEWGAVEGESYYCLEIVKVYSLYADKKLMWLNIKHKQGV